MPRRSNVEGPKGDLTGDIDSSRGVVLWGEQGKKTTSLL